MVAVVQDARTRRPVPDAIVEVLTPNEALITTLDAEANGRARGRVREGTYRLRVQHPRYVSDARRVHIVAGHTTEVRMGLTPRAGSSPPAAAAEHAIQEGARAIQRFVRGLLP